MVRGGGGSGCEFHNRSDGAFRRHDLQSRLGERMESVRLDAARAPSRKNSTGRHPIRSGFAVLVQEVCGDTSPSQEGGVVNHRKMKVNLQGEEVGGKLAKNGGKQPYQESQVDS